MKKYLLPLVALVLFHACATPPKSVSQRGPWDLAELKKTPAAEWGLRTGLVQEVYYQGEPFHGKPTRIFAYLGRPAEGQGPFPAVVLVHGGGGKAFRDWTVHWAKRGYVALAMDTAGCGPAGALPDGGPNQDDANKFHEFTDPDARDMWSYHAVAAVARGHSLLASLPEVDRARIGITGISWGGYLTCIVAGIDDRFKVAVPVYGCGFLGDNSAWRDGSLARLSRATRARWLHLFDPSQYLGGVRCPILFLNGTTDFANSSRPMEPEEKVQIQAAKKQLFEVPVALDALSVVVHKDNPVSVLTLTQVGKIYSGYINNWKQVGGPDAPIVRYSRESSSGTYSFVKDEVLKGRDYASDCQTMSGTSEIAEVVARDKNGIGYGGVAYFAKAPGVKIVSIKKTDIAPEISPLGPNGLPGFQVVYSHSYGLFRPLYVYAAGQPEGEKKTYLDWILGPDGQKIVEQVEYIPLPKK